jgi:hypothetical protein
LSLSEQVANTLQALTNRPGVESTLILSRKDGSIIKVAGILDEPSEHLSPTSATAEASAATSMESRDASDEAMAHAGTGPTRAERLASDIFLFVTAASYLATSLESTAPSNANTIYKNNNGYGHPQKGKTTAMPELEVELNPVQLLRMRSKKHEIVIFPDPNFLCCVVQNMDRQSR